ncbi:MAG: DUF1289 domain-containing protein [Betaproteobacteria bacterium]|nr:DUF1289 domain-containing protein [Betaproteobacteria bacterium]
MSTEYHNPPVPSPCINICRMNPVSKICEGCLRTLDEIADWSVMDNPQKREVLHQLSTRRRST